MNDVQGEQGFSIYRLRWIGYGLLILSLLDTIAVLIPANFGNRVWELQTIGAVVERVPVPLLAMALIFFGEGYDRTGFEDLLLKVLSWVSLLLAVIFLLMLPLGIFGTIYVNNQNNKQINTQANQQLAQLQQVEDKLNKGTPEDLKNLAGELTRLGVQADTQNPQELKNQILSRITPAKERLQAQSATVQSSQRMGLFKNAIKWLLGALISSVLFFTIWRGTDWAR
ncbi:HpsJ-like protein, cyanoexosortase A-associated [Microcoleus sp. herbarium12]|jgi:ABC-type multidrug transport system fused ATPase/permease subunit|uniref:HpsJ-like protein, cyanoexosortase A-associated n=1 Tax=Microcoleus sp. herbarium12 TaxID=3055437 RepID=UPI002FD6ABFC